MQKIQLGDFLSVTINSCKLIQIINNILENIAQHSNNINKINQQLLITNHQIQQNHQSNALQIKSLQQYTQKQNNNLNNNLNQIIYRYDGNMKLSLEKFSKIQTQILQISNQNHSKQQQLNYRINLIDDKITAINNTFVAKEDIQDIKKKIQEMNYNIQQLANKTNKIVDNKAVKTHKQFKMQKSLKDNQNNNIENIAKKKISHLSVNKLSNIQIFQKQQNKSNKSIKQQLQKSNKLQDNNLINDQIIDKQNSLHKFIELSTTKTNQIVDVSNLYFKQMEQLQSGIKKEIGYNSYSINLIQTKVVANEEKIATLNRKIERQDYKINEIRNIVKRLQNQKGIQEKTLSNLRMQLQNTKIFLQKMIKPKLDQELFQKEKKKIYEKVEFAFEKFYQKADKIEVKKAILFIQEKLKQIILLVSNDQNLEKQGAISRMQIKCLSCDKQQQSKFIANESKTIRLKNKQPTRIQSSHIRRKIRTNHMSGDIQQQIE